MDPVWWLAIGLVVASGLLGSGYFAGRASLADDLRRVEDRNGLLLEQLDEALAQGDRGAEAARIVVASARRAAAARRAGSPRERRGMLLDGSSDPAEGDPPAW